MGQPVLGRCHRVETGGGTHAYLQGERGEAIEGEASSIRLTGTISVLRDQQSGERI